MLLLDSQPTLRTKNVATVTGRGLPRKFQDIIALEQDLVTKGLNAKGEKELLLLLQDVFSGWEVEVTLDILTRIYDK